MITTRWSVLGTLPAVLAETAVAAFIGLNGVDNHPATATPNTVAVASGSIRLADSDDDQMFENLDQLSQEEQQEAAQRERHRALLLRLGPGNAESSDEAFHQKVQQSHHISYYRPRQRWRLLLMLIPLSPNADKGGRHERSKGTRTWLASPPGPARPRSRSPR